MIHIFNSVPMEYGMNGVTGFNYQALKDFIHWNNLKTSKYVPILLLCFDAWMKGKNKASK